MPKRLRDTPIYLAPQIYAQRDVKYNPIIDDEKTGQRLDPNNINDKIIIYERQVNEWFLERASKLVTGKNNGFIILMIATSYIEGVQQYIKGEKSDRHSKEFFREGFRRIFGFNISNFEIDKFYKHVRCGLFHNGMSDDPIVIGYDMPLSIDYSQPGIIKINPRLFLVEIQKDFSDYIIRLKDPNNLVERGYFDRMFSVM